jgi:hypothetical protein
MMSRSLTISQFQKITHEIALLFPNKNICMKNVGSFMPYQMQQFLDSFNESCDTVLLLDELWRHPECTEIIINHPNLAHKNVFMISSGYQNTQLAPRTWMISWPNYFLYSLNLESDFTTKPIDLKFGFNCLNNGTQLHRILLGYQLYQHGVLDQVLFTQNNQQPLDAVIFDTWPNFEKYKNLLPIKLPDPMDPITGNVRDFGPYVYHYSYQDSYCNIVTESETDGFPNRLNLEQITEKSYKPFVAKQIPIMLASRGHIAYLKGLGFEMMEHLLPPGYDMMWTEEKISAIVDVVSKGRNFIRDFYFAHTKEIEHNHKLWFSGSIKKTIAQRIANTINL